MLPLWIPFLKFKVWTPDFEFVLANKDKKIYIFKENFYFLWHQLARTFQNVPNISKDIIFGNGLYVFVIYSCRRIWWDIFFIEFVILEWQVVNYSRTSSLANFTVKRMLGIYYYTKKIYRFSKTKINQKSPWLYICL